MKCSVFPLLLLASMVNAQVVLSHFPQNMQLFPRNLATNTAAVRIAGSVQANATDSLLLNVERSDGLQYTHLLAVGATTFDTVVDIEALLEHYHFSIWLKNNSGAQLLAQSENVVAGDVLVVQGQSNAQAVAYNGDANVWQNNYVRCYGSSNPNGYTDSLWYLAEGNGYFTPGAIGQWALRMGALVQERLHVPVAVVNGADPGKPIEFFQRNDAQPDDPATNYGRLLQRLRRGGLDGHIRAILYYQGESDGDRADVHKTLFEALYADWVADYPGVEQFYVVQVREGCGAPSLQLRQYQKDFAQYLPNMHSTTANGIAGHDGCHYSVVGYGQLGEKMFKHLAADLYHMPVGEQLDVNVSSAFFSNASNTEITLFTDADSLIAAPGSGADFRLLGAGVSVVGIRAEGNRLLLQLDEPVYEPGARLVYTGHSGDQGGWVLNRYGYGLFSFNELPIDSLHTLPDYDLPGIMSGSGNCLVLDGANDCLYAGAVLGESYTKEAWISLQPGGLGNNILSGAQNTAFWAPQVGSDYLLCAGHNGGWLQVSDPQPLIPYEWTHVAVSYDALLGELKLYRNGKLVSAAQGIAAHNDPELYIGAYVGAYTFKGKIDEVRVWNSVRTLADIRDNMCRKLHGDEAGLSAYYRFDQLDGAVAANSAGSAAAAQLLNFQFSGWQRSAAPIGTRSTHTYTPTTQLSLSLPSGDSLVLSDLVVPDWLQLYAVEETPNVLEAPQGHVVVDNDRYFGVFFPENSIDTFTLRYYYKGNPFATVAPAQLGLLRRRHNAQPFWEAQANALPDTTLQVIQGGGAHPQECILSLKAWTPPPALPVLMLVAGPASCFDADDGSVQAVVVGGTPPYLYSFNGGPFQTDSVWIGGSGVVEVVLRDADGTEVSAQSLVTAPDALVLHTTVFSNGIFADAAGGTSPYQYSLDGGAWQDNGAFTGLAAGAHTLALRDAQHCTATATDLIVLTATEAPERETEMSVLPNPASSQVYLRAPGRLEQIRFIDLAGRLQLQYPASNGGPVDIGRLTPGWYLVTAENAAGQVYRGRLSVVR